MNEKLIAALDVRNMIPTCEMIIKSAVKRKESRAAHYRSDCPNEKKSWQKNIISEPSKNGAKLSTRSIIEPSKKVQKLVNSEDVDHHLLE